MDGSKLGSGPEESTMGRAFALQFAHLDSVPGNVQWSYLLQESGQGPNHAKHVLLNPSLCYFI